MAGGKQPPKGPPPPPSVPTWANDRAAQKEVDRWGDDAALQGLRRKNHGRLLWIWGWIVPGLMIVFSLLFAAAIVVWSVHYLTPLEFLRPEQLSKVQSVIFSGALGAIVSNYFNKHLLQ